MRTMSAQTTKVYRGVVEKKNGSRSYHGPFDTERAAKARASQIANASPGAKRWVEVSSLSWVNVDNTVTTTPLEVWFDVDGLGYGYADVLEGPDDRDVYKIRARATKHVYYVHKDHINDGGPIE